MIELNRKYITIKSVHTCLFAYFDLRMVASADKQIIYKKGNTFLKELAGYFHKQCTTFERMSLRQG